MARFSNTPTKARPGPSNIQGTRARTHEGGAGFWPGDPQVELFNACVSGFLADSFYESGDARIDRLVNLVYKCDPAWLRKFIPWLRHTAGMRSAPVVLAAEYGRAGFPHRRSVVDSVLRRADEPGEMLGYWLGRYGRPVPSWMKRGINDAIRRFLYNETSLSKWDGAGRGWRFGDVIEITHPKPKDRKQSDLLRYALDRRNDPSVEIPSTQEWLLAERRWMNAAVSDRRAMLRSERLPRTFTWERLAGWLPGGMDAEAWEAVIPQMGLMAILRNLNNFDRAGISFPTRLIVQQRLTDESEIVASRVMPFRYLTAYKNLEADNYKLALGAGADVAMANMPRIPGRTLIMVDCSGSMKNPVGDGKSRNPLQLSHLAGFMAEAVARRCDKAVIVCYDENPLSRHEIQPHVGVLTAASSKVYQPRGWTKTWTCTNWAFRQEEFDQVLIITDEQSADRDDGTVTVPVVTWNLAGYKAHHAAHGSPNRLLLSGVGDTPLQVLPSLLKRAAGSWPWD